MRRYVSVHFNVFVKFDTYGKEMKNNEQTLMRLFYIMGGWVNNFFQFYALKHNAQAFIKNMKWIAFIKFKSVIFD